LLYTIPETAITCRIVDPGFAERDGTMHLVLFIVFAGICLAGAINLLVQSHPISSALSLIVVMTSLAVLYLLLGAEFLAAAQVIVYGGAIMVLFTFVIMLLNAGREERTLGSGAARVVGFPAVVTILAVLATVILHAAWVRPG
jgi:NADH-quinone oxidoreductase subunit J